jgi:hypothetical protein
MRAVSRSEAPLLAGDSSIFAIVRENGGATSRSSGADAADAVWARLLTAGEPLGAAFVGSAAVTLLDASPHASG